MKVKTIKLFLFIIIFPLTFFSQKNVIKNIILDEETIKPISNVNIFNNKDFTITNDSGVFIFYSDIDTITISHLGYKNITSVFSKLMKNDTIFLEPKKVILDEIKITNKENLIKKTYGKVKDDFPYFAYGENSFLRCIVKKNGKIVKFQDFSLKIGRNTIFTNSQIKKISYNIRILNLRKAGILNKSKKEEDFELLSFSDILNWNSAIFTNPKNYKYLHEKSIDSNFVKINFSRKESFKPSKGIEGYYIINKNKLSFHKIYYNTVFDDISTIPFKEKKNVKWRTISNELIVSYNRSKKNNKLFISNSKLKNIIEVFNDNKKSIYEATYEILTTKNFIPETIKSNFSSEKNIFKAKVKFDANFWKSQNQLLLDDELTKFIYSLDDLKKEYIIYSNFIN